ncbi:MAG: hypothetical protein HN849_24820 [Victivallales bacterium]|nr:hypothetical protein [Victivallales bacterium]
MKRLLLLSIASLATGAPVLADWSLADHLADILATQPDQRIRLTWDGTRHKFGGAILMRCVWLKDGKVQEYNEGMRVGGERKVGQTLLSGSADAAAVAEFRIRGGSYIQIDYGMGDYAIERKAPPALIKVRVEVAGKTKEQAFRVTKNEWQRVGIPFPAQGEARVCIASTRLGSGSHHWPMMVVQGDGKMTSLAETVAASPTPDYAEAARPMSDAQLQQLRPSRWRVTRRPDADILFYRDKPFLSFASKGNSKGYQNLEIECGFNTSYQEGRTFVRNWPENAPRPIIDAKDAVYRELAACQTFGIPFKSAMSLAHCTPFLPPWLVQKEDLGYVGHQMRRGGPTHASIFKAKTLEFYLTGLEQWIKPLQDQPAIFVFSQEDVPSYLDDQSPEAKTRFRAWLRQRFGNDFEAFATYVGGAQGVASFDDAPYPKMYDPPESVGYGRRLSWLKIVWVVETYGDFLEGVAKKMRELAPGTPFTQRYVYSPWGGYLSRRVQADYSYTFGHLTTEGRANRNGVGRKAWGAAYSHVGVLPLPRGGSIGKCWDAKIRRGAITEAELRTNLYTLLANGASGFEYQPFFTVWGESWRSAGLYRVNGEPTPLRDIAAKVIKGAHDLSSGMVHYEAHPDVAVFHDAAASSTPFSGGWNQAKAGVYTLIRECGYHPDPLTLWDMTDAGLRDRKVLVLAGTTSMAPEIIGAVRRYVQNGGTLVAFYNSIGGGFPGCNSYDYAGPVLESAKAVSFRPGTEHLGDVLGILDAGQPGNVGQIRLSGRETDLTAINDLITQGKWLATPICATGVQPVPGAEVLATFADGSPAAYRRAHGEGQVYVFAYDLPTIANNLTIPALYKPWDDLMESRGCRKVLDTGDYFVEAGVWRDDAGKRTVFLINHDQERLRTIRLPDETTVALAAGESTTRILDR